MLQTPRATRGMVSAPHHLAAQAGLRVLREGGNAIEAVLAAAATMSVVYPHMNGVGGDGFWLINKPKRGSQEREAPRAINAVGAAGLAVEDTLYSAQELDEIPSRGPLAANTVAGTVAGWQTAYYISSKEWGGSMPLDRLLEEAIHYAWSGFPVTRSQYDHVLAKQEELEDAPGWAGVFLVDGAPPPVGSIFKQPALAETLKTIARQGFNDFYRGDLARKIAGDLEWAGSPVTQWDLAQQEAIETPPLQIGLRDCTGYNVGPPSQGLTSLMILGLYERLQCETADSLEHVHGLVEATKMATLIRNQYITDPEYMTVDPANFLDSKTLDALAADINVRQALPWPVVAASGDTVWMGAIDEQGRAVSFIQSIYWEFGSGVVLPESGILWQNRGCSFSLDENDLNYVEPRRLPFHTINPAMALFKDGRVMVYGTMGGDGQPQTQAALFTRYAHFGQELQAAVSAPRWLLGRTWGDQTTELRIEPGFPDEVIAGLKKAGHKVAIVEPYSDIMGHAGAIVMHTEGDLAGLREGAADPRCDGSVAAF